MMIKRIYINFVFPYKIILNKILFYINKKILFFPGFGTFCLICLGGGDFWVEHLMIGLIQLFCTPFMIGWIWSLAWGIHTVRKSA